MAEVTVFYEGPIVSRDAARASGLKYFFTGVPCKHGHVDRRLVSGGTCHFCYHDVEGPGHAIRQAWRRANRDKVAKYHRRWKTKNPTSMKNQHRAWRRANPEAARARDRAGRRRKLLANPNFDRDHHRKRAEQRAGRPRPDSCEVCGRGGRISYDHDHATGKFRGWLCRLCNVALGHVGDDPTLLRKLARYVERARGKPAKQTQEPLLDLMEQANGRAAPPPPG